MKNLLCLDLSSKSSGYAVNINGQLVDYGCFTSASTDAIKRIYIMRDAIKELITKYQIQQLVLEEVPPKEGNERTRKVLMWLQAAIVFTAYDIDKKIQIEYLEPSQWRKVIGIKTGKGIERSSLKAEDIKYVKAKYNIEVNDDVADAICIMNAYIEGFAPAF